MDETEEKKEAMLPLGCFIAGGVGVAAAMYSLEQGEEMITTKEMREIKGDWFKTSILEKLSSEKPEKTKVELHFHSDQSKKISLEKSEYITDYNGLLYVNLDLSNKIITCDNPKYFTNYKDLTEIYYDLTAEIDTSKINVKIGPFKELSK